jgi:hypothetical protein
MQASIQRLKSESDIDFGISLSQDSPLLYLFVKPHIELPVSNHHDLEGIPHKSNLSLVGGQAELRIAQDATAGAINGVVRGTSMAVTQAVLGANPFTAGIGLVAPDVVALLTQKDKLSEQDYQNRAMGVVGKGALATALVCAGPIGWLGLAGYSIVSAYGQASQQGAPALNRAKG